MLNRSRERRINEMNMVIMKAMVLIGVVLVSPTTSIFAADGGDNGAAEVMRKDKRTTQRKKLDIPSRMVVAISKFENKSGATPQQFETIRARVQQCVVGARKFEVVEREQLKTAMSEQVLSTAGHTNAEDEDTPQSGKLKAASYVIYGNVLYCGVDKNAVAFGGISSVSVKYKVELQIKITNGETGRILAQKSAFGYGVDRSMATENAKSLAGQGMRDAINEACHVAADMLRDVAYPAKVIKVGRRDITLNMTDEEVQEDDVFDLIEADEPMTDPDTGAFLGFDGDDIGRVRIKRVGPMVSKAIPVEDGEMSLKDLDLNEHTYIVRRVSKATLAKEAKKRSQQRKGAFEGRL